MSALLHTLNTLFPRSPVPVRFLWIDYVDAVHLWADFWCELINAERLAPPIQWNRSTGKFEAVPTKDDQLVTEVQP